MPGMGIVRDGSLDQASLNHRTAYHCMARKDFFTGYPFPEQNALPDKAWRGAVSTTILGQQPGLFTLTHHPFVSSPLL
jgi:hypothetical protein